ncbi:hypothetical protein CERZMDRAFT_86236 [Cercospora zeae-maydis SCOH1-5]|uniref:Uncharacterized protein n=1 Tax=Cercospora zeae-maydis SCOH1-5 TaxID=717836 RepID=A0A6A6FAT2_9PEZI|nr:hypothetical protein CERZMDRAFT_86236 [Cercospora zeae-maydis SCOH1-5]
MEGVPKCWRFEVNIAAFTNRALGCLSTLHQTPQASSSITSAAKESVIPREARPAKSENGILLHSNMKQIRTNVPWHVKCAVATSRDQSGLVERQMHSSTALIDSGRGESSKSKLGRRASKKFGSQER